MILTNIAVLSIIFDNNFFLLFFCYTLIIINTVNELLQLRIEFQIVELLMSLRAKIEKVKKKLKIM